MCGLIGGVTSTSFSFKEQEVFRNLFLLNSLRGTHGCGMFTLFEEKKGLKKKYYYDTVKSELPSSAFIWTKDYDSFMSGNNMLIMGHSRHATIGKVNQDNCHPFISEDTQVIGFHNGTVRGNFDKKDKYETDSEAIVNNIAEKGLKDTLEHLYDKSWTDSGVAYAFQYYDRTASKAYIIRNSARPLCFAWASDCCFWASEQLFLMFSLIRAGFAPDKVKYKVLEPGELATIDPYAGDISDIVKFEKEWFKPPKKTVVTYTNPAYNSQNQVSGNNTGYGSNRKPTGGWWEDQEDWDEYPYGKSKGAVTPLNYYKIGAKQISQGRLENILKSGCGVCGTVWPVSQAVSSGLMITQGDEVICEECMPSAQKDFGVDRKKCDHIKKVACN